MSIQLPAERMATPSTDLRTEIARVGSMQISFRDAETVKAEALATCSLVSKVTDAKSQELAVDAQTQCRRLINDVRKTGKTLRQPLTDFSKRIIKAEDDFVARLEAEELRVAKLIGDFQALEQARLRAAAEAKRLEEQRLADESARIELERQKALAASQTHEQAEAVQAEFGEQQRALTERQEAAAQAVLPEPVRSTGQVIKDDWEITVQDVHDLYRHHCNCVQLSPRLAEIKALLNAGIKVHGVHAEKITKAGVRLSQTKVIAI